jgi:antitoxin YefM
MEKSIPITEARNRFTELPEELAKDRGQSALAVTRRGKPVLAVLPWELYESLVETLEILGDEELLAAFRQSVKDIRKGKISSLEAVERRLNHR